MDALIIAAQVQKAPAREILRDSQGRIIGIHEPQKLTRKTLARDARGKLVGSYGERSGTTRDAGGRLIGRGNLLPVLLWRR